MKSDRATLELGYLSLRDAATWAGVSPKTMRRWFGKGLPHHQAGPREKVLVRPTDIAAFLTRQAAPTIDVGAMVDDVVKTLTVLPYGNGLSRDEGSR